MTATENAGTIAGTAGADGGDMRLLRNRGLDLRDPEREAELTRLFDAHHHQLVRLAALLGAGADAEDVVAEAFCDLYRRWNRLRDPAKAAPYLRASVCNQVRMRHRHLAVVRRHPEPVQPDAGSAEQEAVLREDQREVAAALLRLPERQRQALVLRRTAAKLPDLIACAKPLGVGIPMGAVILKEHVAAAIKPGEHGTTFGGGPLACRTSLEYFKIIEDEKLLDHIRETGAYFKARLEELKELPIVKEIRGIGLMLAVELTVPGKDYVKRMLDRGYIINCTHDTALRFLPPFIITQKQIDKFVRTLKDVLATT